MKADKGNITMNVLFGAFLAVSIVLKCVAIRDRNKREKEKKQCNCGGKG